jgi:hypothetical protein
MKTCANCDKDFEPWYETVCSDCQEEYAAEVCETYGKLQGRIDKHKKALTKAVELIDSIEADLKEDCGVGECGCVSCVQLRKIKAFKEKQND